MEIRMLNSYELRWGVQTAQEIYNQCVRPQVTDEAEVAKFFEYVNEENLGREMSQGRIFLWGVFDRGYMCAVSAMQGNGHTSILYVRPEYQHLNLDRRLSKVMENYAKDVLGIGAVSYPVKKVPGKVILGMTAGVMLFLTVLFTGVTVHHMATDGLITDKVYEERMKDEQKK